MTKQELHDLAVAFAAVKLKEYQLEQRAKNNQPFFAASGDDEIRYYAKMYKSIIEGFENEYNDIG